MYWNILDIFACYKIKVLVHQLFQTWRRSKIWDYFMQFSTDINCVIIIIIIYFMQGIFTYIPKTNYVPREYSVAAILLLLFMVLISPVSLLNLLCFYISTFRSMCAVPNMTVFWSSLTSCFSGMLLASFLNDFEVVPVAPIINHISVSWDCNVYFIIIIIIITHVRAECHAIETQASWELLRLPL